MIATVVMQFPDPEALVILTEVDEIWTEAFPGEEAAPAETRDGAPASLQDLEERVHDGIPELGDEVAHELGASSSIDVGENAQ